MASGGAAWRLVAHSANFANSYLHSPCRVQIKPATATRPAAGDDGPPRDRGRRTVRTRSANRKRQDFTMAATIRRCAADRGSTPTRRGCAALQRVPRVFPTTWSSTSSPTTTTTARAYSRPRTLHREGLIDQRRDRPPAPRATAGFFARRDLIIVARSPHIGIGSPGLPEKMQILRSERRSTRRGHAQLVKAYQRNDRCGARRLRVRARCGDHALLRRVGLPIDSRHRSRGSSTSPAERRVLERSTTSPVWPLPLGPGTRRWRSGRGDRAE